MKVVDELQQIAIDNPTKDNIELYEKMQNLFFKHVKDVNLRGKRKATSG